MPKRNQKQNEVHSVHHQSRFHEIFGDDEDDDELSSTRPNDSLMETIHMSAPDGVAVQQQSPVSDALKAGATDTGFPRPSSPPLSEMGYFDPRRRSSCSERQKKWKRV